MEPFILEPTTNSPEIIFDPDAHIFSISGISRPEDVRSFYYPVLEWCERFREEMIEPGLITFDENNPLNVRIRLKYFNSSSAKFLYDIFMELGELARLNQKVNIYWHYDAGDDDMRDAGEEMSEIAEIPFEYVEN